MFAKVEDLVVVFEACETGDLDLGDVLYAKISMRVRWALDRHDKTYVDGKVGVGKHLEVERLVALVPDT